MRVRSVVLFLVSATLGIRIFVVWSRLSTSNYAAAINNGRTEIELASDFDELFQNAEHFISYYPRAGTPIWNSKTGLHQRYVLTMKFDIAFDLTRRHPRPISIPQFYLVEIDKIQRLPDGRTEITYTQNQHRFGLDDWTQIKSSGGSFRVLGIELNDSNPLKDFDEVWTNSYNADNRVRVTD